LEVSKFSKKNGANRGYRVLAVLPLTLYPSKVLMVELVVRLNLREKMSGVRPKIGAAFLRRRSMMLERLEDNSFMNCNDIQHVLKI